MLLVKPQLQKLVSTVHIVGFPEDRATQCPDPSYRRSVVVVNDASLLLCSACLSFIGRKSEASVALSLSRFLLSTSPFGHNM
jgi:hypothetical protein